MPKRTNLAKKWTRKAEYKELKQDMIDDLEVRGLIGKQYTDKVEEYMSLWCLFQMLNEDISKRGVLIEYSNGATQKGVTDNKSVSMITRVSAQMLNIFTALGFKDLATSAKPQMADGDDEL